MSDDMVETRIRTIRGRAVILDEDLAALYGVETRRLNEQVRRNAARFPEDFAFRLAADEWDELKALRSQDATLDVGRGRHRKYPPVAFTEHGAIMAANVLRSGKAIEMSVFVVRAFVRMREELATTRDLARRLAEIESELVVHDAALGDLYAKIRPLLLPPALPPRKRIGFGVKEAPGVYRFAAKRGKGRLS